MIAHTLLVCFENDSHARAHIVKHNPTPALLTKHMIENLTSNILVTKSTRNPSKYLAWAGDLLLQRCFWLQHAIHLRWKSFRFLLRKSDVDCDKTRFPMHM